MRGVSGEVGVVLVCKGWGMLGRVLCTDSLEPKNGGMEWNDVHSALKWKGCSFKLTAGSLCA